MSRSIRSRRLPGTTLLRIARLLFNERLLAAVVLPTIADLQREVDEAGDRLVMRLRARWRGYRAFWALVFVAPMAFPAAPAHESGSVAVPDAIARLAATSIAIVLLTIIGPVIGGWMALATAGGALVAIAMHAWYGRHPTNIPAPSEPEDHHTPQINFSSTAVAGNIGGLIFVVGSVLIVAIGVPSLVWFLFAGLVFGGLLAMALLAWHTSHPKQGLPQNLIVLR